MDYRGYWDVLAMPLADGRAGLFTSGRVIPESLLWRNDAPYFPAADPLPAVDHLGDEVIFGGYPIQQFGHFLLEGVARLWFAARNPDLPIVWLHRRPAPWQSEILELLGIRNREIVIDRPTHFDRVIVPEAGFRIGGQFDPEHAAFLRVYPEAAIRAGKRVWLSRSRLPENLGKIIDLDKVETRLAEAGWTIFHPQETTVRSQLAMIADAERLAGVAGSAFHIFVLMKQVKSRVDLFTRQRFSQSYDIIAERNRIDQHIHFPDSEIVTPGAFPSRSVFRWKSFEHVYRTLL